jgi:hypothetical protein
LADMPFGDGIHGSLVAGASRNVPKKKCPAPNGFSKGGD